MVNPHINSTDSETTIFKQNPFSVENIRVTLASLFAQGLDNDLHQAATWALLQHGTNRDGTHYHMKTPAGLHPTYIFFNPFNKSEHKIVSRTELIEASLSDVFDMVSLIINQFYCLQFMLVVDYHARLSRWWNLASNQVSWLWDITKPCCWKTYSWCLHHPLGACSKQAYWWWYHHACTGFLSRVCCTSPPTFHRMMQY